MARLHQRRFQIGLRTLFVGATVVCVILGVRNYRQNLGKRRIAAASTLQEYGIEVLEAGHSGAGYNYSSRTGSWHVEIPGVRRYEQNTDGLVDTLLADAMSAKQTILVIPNVVRQPAKEIQRQVGELPNLQTIYVNDGMASDQLVDLLKQSNPAVEIRFSSHSVTPSS